MGYDRNVPGNVYQFSNTPMDRNENKAKGRLTANYSLTGLAAWSVTTGK